MGQKISRSTRVSGANGVNASVRGDKQSTAQATNDEVSRRRASAQVSTRRMSQQRAPSKVSSRHTIAIDSSETAAQLEAEFEAINFADDGKAKLHTASSSGALPSTVSVDKLKAFELLAFGANDQRQLGVLGGGSAVPLSTPLPVSLSANVSDAIASIACGAEHSICVTTSGQVYSWGRSEHGQLGRAVTAAAPAETPCLVPTSSFPRAFRQQRVVKAACGGNHTMLLMESGVVLACGANERGQLGVGDTKKRADFRDVRVLREQHVIDVACGAEHTLFVTVENDVYACGANAQKQVGVGDAAHYTKPTLVEALFGLPIVQVTCGDNFSLALTVSGNVYGWGANESGQLAVGANVAVIGAPSWIHAFKGKRIVRLSAGARHCVARTDAGQLIVWGARFEHYVRRQTEAYGADDENVAHTCSVVVTQLDETVADDDVRRSFSAFGVVRSIRAGGAGTGRQTRIVEFASSKAAQASLNLDKSLIGKCKARVRLHKSKDGDEAQAIASDADLGAIVGDGHLHIPARVNLGRRRVVDAVCALDCTIVVCELAADDDRGKRDEPSSSSSSTLPIGAASSASASKKTKRRGSSRGEKPTSTDAVDTDAVANADTDTDTDVVESAHAQTRYEVLFFGVTDWNEAASTSADNEVTAVLPTPLGGLAHSVPSVLSCGARFALLLTSNDLEATYRVPRPYRIPSLTQTAIERLCSGLQRREVSSDEACSKLRRVFAFCYTCLFDWVREHGYCPVTRLPMSTKEIRRLYTQ